jgi:hypothetical protein
LKVDLPPVISPPPPAPPAGRSALAWVLPGVAGLVLAALLLVLHQFDPAHSGFYPGCTFHKVTGLNCPGCGGLRATHQLLHGNVLTALHHNAMVVLGAPLVVGWIGVWLWQRWRGRPARLSGLSNHWLWALFGAVVVFSVLRNLPFSWFAWLSP